MPGLPNSARRAGGADSAVPCTFDLLSDDLVHVVAGEVMRFDAALLFLQLLAEAEASRRSVVALMLTCTRLARVISSDSSPLATELRARAMTKIVPRAPSAPFAFSKQIDRELTSRQQLRMLKGAQVAMACHCAMDCCRRIQKAFNSDLANDMVSPGKGCRGRLVAAMESCSLMAPCSSGTAAFAYRRKKRKKLRVEGRGKRYEDELVRIEASDKGTFVETSCLLVDSSDMSSPLFMRSSADGQAVLWVCAAHDVDEEIPFGCAFVWEKNWTAGCRIEPPDMLRPYALSAQDAWFMQDEDNVTLIVVAWSTNFFHPSGHLVGSSDARDRGTYLFATYSIASGVVEECSVGLPICDASLLGCSPTHSGCEVLALVTRESSTTPRRRTTVLHDFRSAIANIVPHNVPSRNGPVAAAISPTGDCVVALHKTEYKRWVANVQVRTSEDGFTPVQKLDLSTCLALHPRDETPFMQSDLVKASFRLGCSPCGRYFYVHDARPLFGERAAAKGLVVVDMAARMDRTQSLRALPMFPADEQAPRSVCWTDAGIWLMPPGTDEHGSIGARGGALCLLSHARP